MTQDALQRLLVRRAAAMNTKARQTGAVGRVTAEELALVLLESDGVCAYCGFEIDPFAGTFDHVLSFAQGGPNRRSNLVRSCMSCNRTKASQKSPEELRAWLAATFRCETCAQLFRPRYADWKRGLGRVCSRSCAGTKGRRARVG